MRVDEPSGHRNRRDPLRRLLLHRATVCYDLPTAGRSARCSKRRMVDPNSATQAAAAWERANRVRAVLNSETPAAERPVRCLRLALRVGTSRVGAHRVTAPRIAARQARARQARARRVRALRANRSVRRSLSSLEILGCSGDRLVVGILRGLLERQASRATEGQEDFPSNVLASEEPWVARLDLG